MAKRKKSPLKSIKAQYLSYNSLPIKDFLRLQQKLQALQDESITLRLLTLVKFIYDLSDKELDSLSIEYLSECFDFIETKFEVKIRKDVLSEFEYGHKWRCDYDVSTWSVLQWIHFERLLNKFSDDKQVERTLAILPIYIYISDTEQDYTAARFQDQDKVHRLPTRYVFPSIQKLQSSLKRVRSEFPDIYDESGKAESEGNTFTGIDSRIQSDYGAMYELMSFVATYDNETIEVIQQKNVRDFLDRAQYVILANKRDAKRNKSNS